MKNLAKLPNNSKYLEGYKDAMIEVHNWINEGCDIKALEIKVYNEAYSKRVD